MSSSSTTAPTAPTSSTSSTTMNVLLVSMKLILGAMLFLCCLYIQSVQASKLYVTKKNAYLRQQQQQPMQEPAQEEQEQERTQQQQPWGVTRMVFYDIHVPEDDDHDVDATLAAIGQQLEYVRHNDDVVNIRYTLTGNEKNVQVKRDIDHMCQTPHQTHCRQIASAPEQHDEDEDSSSLLMLQIMWNYCQREESASHLVTYIHNNNHNEASSSSSSDWATKAVMTDECQSIHLFSSDDNDDACHVCSSSSSAESNSHNDNNMMWTASCDYIQTLPSPKEFFAQPHNEHEPWVTSHVNVHTCHPEQQQDEQEQPPQQRLRSRSQEDVAKNQ